MPKPPGKCVFCGDFGALTGEHMFSSWTHRFLPPRRTGTYQALRTMSHLDRSEFTLRKKSGDIRDWKVRCVCEFKCNNGWMRKAVDEPAQSVMLPLITGKSTRLSPDDQRIIATWATMKAMVAEHDFGAWVTTHHMQRKRMMAKQLPPEHGWGVWIGHYVRNKWVPHWGSNPFLILPDAKAEELAGSPATYFNGCASTQVIGQLFIHVIRSPKRDFVTRWRFAPPNNGTLFRIWPRSKISINWPGKTMTDRDADYVSGAIKDFFFRINTRP